MGKFATIAINKKIKVVFPVVKKLPDVFIGKNSTASNKAKGIIILFSNSRLRSFLLLKKFVNKLNTIIIIKIKPTTPNSLRISM